MRLVSYEEFKRLLLEERDKIPLTVPAAVYELVKEKPNTAGQYIKHGIKIALRCLERCQNIATDIAQPQWISCAERLPTETGMYRVCHKSKIVADRYFYSDAPEIFTKFGNDPVTHWKPIEEPPVNPERGKSNAELLSPSQCEI